MLQKKYPTKREEKCQMIIMKHLIQPACIFRSRSYRQAHTGLVAFRVFELGAIRCACATGTALSVAAVGVAATHHCWHSSRKGIAMNTRSFWSQDFSHNSRAAHQLFSIHDSYFQYRFWIWPDQAENMVSCRNRRNGITSSATLILQLYYFLFFVVGVLSAATAIDGDKQ